MARSDEPFVWDQEIKIGEEPVYKNETNRYVTTLCRKGDNWYIGIRQWWTADKSDIEPDDKEWRPGRQGVSFPLDVAQEVYAQVGEALTEVTKHIKPRRGAKPVTQLALVEE
jgi:hypothetical protein